MRCAIIWPHWPNKNRMWWDSMPGATSLESGDAMGAKQWRHLYMFTKTSYIFVSCFSWSQTSASKKLAAASMGWPLKRSSEWPSSFGACGKNSEIKNQCSSEQCAIHCSGDWCGRSCCNYTLRYVLQSLQRLQFKGVTQRRNMRNTVVW